MGKFYHHHAKNRAEQGNFERKYWLFARTVTGSVAFENATRVETGTLPKARFSALNARFHFRS